MFRNLLIACFVSSILIILTFGFRAVDTPADLRYLNPSDIHTLDPARMSWTQDFRVAINIWEGLTAIDPKSMQPVAGAALFPPEVSDDGKTYRFTIRDDARWSNGEYVTAQDFFRGWRRAMEPGTAADYSVFFTDHIVGAKQYVDWRHDEVNKLVALGKQVGAANQTPLRKQGTNQNRDRKGAASSDVADTSHRFTNLEIANHAHQLDRAFEQVGLRAIDEHTLEVALIQPCAYFPDLVASPVFSPIHSSIERMREGIDDLPITAEALVVYDPQWTKPEPQKNGYPGLITNGPYRLADWVLKRRARLEVNPYHREAATITCRTIDMLVYDNVDAALMAYEAGDLDFLPGIDVSYDHEIARLASTGVRPDFHLCPVLATMFMNLNCKSEIVNGQRNPFVDSRVRKAFALAVDKKLVVENVLGRGDRVATSFIPANSIPGYMPPIGPNPNEDLARSLLSEAGFPNGVGLPPIQFLYTMTDEKLCQALARMWQETLGARIELISKESKTFADDKQNRRYMIAKGNWYADYNDPTTFLDTLATGNGNNDSGFSNGQFDRLLIQARGETDVVRRSALLREAESIVVQQEFPIIPILHYSTAIAINPKIHGLHPNPRLWFPFKYVTVTR